MAHLEKSRAPRRKTVRLESHDRELLVKLYLKWRIPTDQFDGRPEESEAFELEWRTLTGRKDPIGELVRYMKTQRKHSRWPRLEGNHTPSPPMPELSPDETEALIAIYQACVTVQDCGSDVLSSDTETAQLIAKRFSEETGRIVPVHQLRLKLTALRKRGLLPKVKDRERDSHVLANGFRVVSDDGASKPYEEEKPDEGIGFEDIDNAVD